MNSRSLMGNPFIQTAVYSVIFFVILIILSFASGSATSAPLKTDPTLVLIALIPFIIWLIVSGRLQELDLPGGGGAKFRRIAQEPVKAEPGPMPVEVGEVAEKGPTEEVDRIPKTARVLSFELRKGTYTRDGITAYLNKLKENPNFDAVVFTDKGKKFQGLMKARDFQALHELQPRDTAGSINTGDILRKPSAITNAIRAGSSNIEALDRMEQAGTDILPVIDGLGNYVGYVTRNRIVSDMMRGLITGGGPTFGGLAPKRIRRYMCTKCGRLVTAQGGEPSASPVETGEACVDPAGNPSWNENHQWTAA